MDPLSFQRAGEIFTEVCDLPQEEQSQALDRLCGDQPDLRALVEDLLEADRRPEDLEGLVAEEAEVIAGEPLRDPVVIGHYRVLRRLGEGGMGVVYEAEQDHPRRLVAIKCIHPWLQSEDLRARFHAEAQAMGQLLHPGIPQVYEAGEEAGRLYLVMERVVGEPITDWLERGSPDLRERVELVLSVCRAVEHAHARGVVHCDLKPANVLVDASGQPRLLDFGIAATRDWGREDRPSMGTPRYMCPEQIRGGSRPEPRWDVFALGVLAWEILSGSCPFGTTTRDAAEVVRAIQAGPPPMSLPGLMGRDLEAILRQAVHAERDQRTDTVAALREDLERALAHRPVRVRGRRPSYLIQAWTLRNRWRLAVVALALPGLILSVSLARGRWQDHQREVEAEARWSQVEPQVRAGDDLLFHTYCEDPTHQGTRALARAWLDRAGHLREQGRAEEERLAWTEAYARAVSSSQVREALQGLAEQAARSWSWSTLDGALSLLHTWGGEAPELELTAALARRDLVGAADLAPDAPMAPMLRALSRARPCALDAGRAWRADLDGDGRLETFGSRGAGVDVLRGDGELVRVELPDSPRIQWLPHHQVLLVQGDSVDDPWVRAYPLGPDQLAGEPVTAVWEWPEQRAWSATEVDLDGDGLVEIYLGTGPYSRRLLRIDPDQGWRVSSPHPSTDAAASDVVCTDAGDLDQDGQPELLVAASEWSAWDLRVFHPAPGGGLELLDRLRLGAVRPMTVLDTPLGPRVAFHLYRALDGSPPSFHLAAWDGARVSLERSWTLPHPEPLHSDHWTDLVRGDWDGDGLDDLALSGKNNGQRATLLMRQLPEGGVATAVLADLYVLDAWDEDGDGDDEIYVLAKDRPHGDRAFVLGTGEAPLPTLEAVTRPTRSFDLQGLERADDLLAMGLPEAAALAAQRLAPLSDRRDLALLRTARLWEDLEEHERALDLLVGLDQPEARLERARVLAYLFRFAEALEILDGENGPEATSLRAELEPLASPAPTTHLDFSRSLHPSWTIHEPASVWRAGGALHLDPFSDSDLLATLPLERRGPRMGVEAEVHVSQPEIASSLVVELACPGTRTWAKTRYLGASGVVSRVLYTRAGSGESNAERFEVDPASSEEHLLIRLQHRADTGASYVGIHPDQGPSAEGRTVETPVPEGVRCELILRVARVSSYGAPMHLEGQVERLDLEGLVLTGEQGPEGRRLVADGQPRQALDELEPGDHAARAVALTRLGLLEQAAAEVEGVVRQGDPDLPILVRALGPDLASALHRRLGDELYEHWERAHRSCLDHTDHVRCQEALMAPTFVSIPGDTPAQRALLLHRAEACHHRGLDAQAEEELARMLARCGPEDASLAVEAWLLRAELAGLRGEEELARGYEALAVEVSPAPELTRDRLLEAPKAR